MRTILLRTAFGAAARPTFVGLAIPLRTAFGAAARPTFVGLAILLRTAFGAAARPTFVGLAIASLAFTLLACSGTSPPPPQPPMHVGSGGAVAQAPAPESPSTAECEALVAHAIDLDARTRDTQPPPTDAEREQLRATLRPFIEECRAMSRASYECGRAATTPAQLASCQRTPSSSTSNSSVAPPGITPAAPRSP